MISKARIVEMLLQVGQAVGVYLSEDRIELYYQKLRNFHPVPLSKAVDAVIDTWEHPNRFPPVGTFVSKARAFSGEGTPNALGRYVRPAPQREEDAERTRRAYEALERFVEMDDAEYWDLVLRLSREKEQRRHIEAAQSN